MVLQISAIVLLRLPRRRLRRGNQVRGLVRVALKVVQLLVISTGVDDVLVMVVDQRAQVRHHLDCTVSDVAIQDREGRLAYSATVPEAGERPPRKRSRLRQVQ